jgi:hypothetical protein
MTGAAGIGDFTGGDSACGIRLVVGRTSESAREMGIDSKRSPRLAILRGRKDVEVGLERKKEGRISKEKKLPKLNHQPGHQHDCERRRGHSH